MKSPTLSLKLLLYSTSLSVLAFLLIKFLILSIKFIITHIWGIESVVSGYWLKPISAADSGLWNHASVYSIYGTELGIPLLIVAVALFIYNKQKRVDQHKTAISVWLLFYSSLSFFSAILSGAVTYSNTYHLLNWFYLPNHIIMALALASPPLFLFFLFKGRGRILKFAPDNSWLEDEQGRRKTHIFGMSIPLIITALLIYLVSGEHPNRYVAYESGLIAAAAFVLVIFPPANTYRKVENHWMPKVNKIFISAVVLIIITGFLRWFF